MNKIIIGVVILVVIIAGVGFYFFFQETRSDLDLVPDQGEVITDETESEPEGEDQVIEDKTKTIIGTSVEGREITAYHYGTGQTELVLIGGIHGGYSWNTSLLAYDLMDYLNNSPEIIPAKVRVTVIPVLNPDGLNKVVGKDGRFTRADVSTSEVVRVSGRFNANNVDLNRNFDCDWQSSAKWQNKEVSGGASAFSEPESQTLRNYIEKANPAGVVVWYSAAGGVYSSNCHSGVLPETQELTQVFATASGYKAFKEFNFYEITGDAVNWLAKQKIPAISVLLTNHQDIESEKNRKGVKALMEYYAK